MGDNSSRSEEKYTNPGSFETEEHRATAYIVSVHKERLLLYRQWASKCTGSAQNVHQTTP
jgi:hypothetical protein